MKHKHIYVYGGRLSRSHIVAYNDPYYVRAVCGSVLYFNGGLEVTALRAMKPKGLTVCRRCERVFAAQTKADTQQGA